MIRSLNISGFKSFLENYIEFGHLTLLTGLNSSGKSSVIQTFLMLEKAFKGESNILIDNHGAIKGLKNPNHEGLVKFIVSSDSEHESIVEIDNDDKYTIAGDKIDFPEIIYISANRYGPKNIIPIFINTSIRNKVGINGENLLQYIESYGDRILDESLIHPKSQGNTLRFNIEGWLNVISADVKFSYVIDDKSDSSYSLFNGYRSSNVGYGLSYSLSVIATLLISTLIPNTILIIENPEAHIHPRGQAEIARLISLCSNLGTQIIIETHSDHIFDSVRIACKEIGGFDTKVKVHWFELNEFRNSRIESPIIDKEGKLDNWPKGLFDQFEINSAKLF